MLTTTKAVNELIQLNLRLYFYEEEIVETKSYFSDQKVRVHCSKLTFDQHEGGEYDVVIHARDGQVDYVDFIDLVSEDSDVVTLYSGVLQENMTEEEACKFIRENLFSALSCFYEARRNELVKG